MCLVALAWKSHPRWRLFMAGNRDEFHARPTAALDRWPPPHGDVVAGRDLRSGGTWMGIGGSGRAAVITNVRLIGPGGEVMTSFEAAPHLNELVHALPWQSEVQRALADIRH